MTTLITKSALFSVLLSSTISFSLHADEETDKSSILRYYEEKLHSNPNDYELLYALGQGYYSLKNYSRAETLFIRALEQNPSDQRIKISLGLTYLFSNKHKKSEFLLKEALANDSSNPVILAALGRINHINYNLDAAENYYLEALKKEQENLATLTFLGNLRLAQHRYREAHDLFKKVLQITPKNQWVQDDLLRAELGPEFYAIKEEVSSGNLQEAAKRLQALLSNHRVFIDLYLLLGDVYVKMHKHQKAIKIYQIGLSLRLDAAPLLTAIGHAYLEDNDYELAEEYFRKALKLAPNNPEVLAGLGQTLYQKGDLRRAESLYDKALAIRPYNLTALTYYSELMTQKKEYDKAAKGYIKILQIEPNKDWVKTALEKAEHGELLDKINRKVKRKKYKKAEQLYRQLIKSAPANTGFYLDFANFYSAQGRVEDAIEVYLKGLKTERNTTPLRIGLGFAYLKNHELNKSEHYFNEALQIDLDNSEALAGLGAIAEEVDNIKKAEKYYLRSLKNDPENISALMLMGKLKIKQERYKEAKRYFEKVHDLNPELEGIERAILDAGNGPILKEIHTSLEEDDFITAESLYLELISKAPHIEGYHLELGRLYMKQNRPMDAARVYQNYLAIAPKSSNVSVALGYAYLTVMQLDKAMQLFESVAKAQNENKEALAGTGEILKKQGKLDESIAIFESILKNDPNHISSLAALGDLYYQLNQYEKAEKIYRKLEILLPEEVWVRNAFQNIHFSPLLNKIATLTDVSGLPKDEADKNRLMAIKLYSNLLKEAPENPEYHLHFGLLLAEMKRFSDAINIYQTGLSLNPQSEELRNALGFSYLYHENLERAQKEFETVFKQNPGNPDTLAGMGRIQELNGQLEEARHYYLRALDTGPYNINALSFIGALQIKLKEYEEAKEIYNRLLHINPRLKWVQEALEEIEVAPILEKIRIHEEKKEYEKATRLYYRIISQGNEGEDYYLGFGNLYVRMKQYPEAIRIFNEGLSKKPDSYKLHTAIGIAYILNEDAENALKWLRVAQKMNSENGEVLAGLGRAAFLNDNLEEARDYYKKALAYSPDNTAALSFYGELLTKEKRYQEAITVYDRLIELDPEATWARNARKQALDGPRVDGAAVLVDIEELEAAKNEYLLLLRDTGNNADYYLYLGDVYLSMGNHKDALWAYHLGLQVDPDSAVLWRATAFAYLDVDKLSSSMRIFNCLLERNSDDADSWAGLGRIYALRGYYYISLSYFNHALQIEPDNETALMFMARGEEEQEHRFSAKKLYHRLADTIPQKRWVRQRWVANHKDTRPLLTCSGGYYEENEWDDNLDDWVGRYQAYGATVRLHAPLSDRLWIAGYVSEDIFKLRDLDDDVTIYYFGVTRSGLEGRWGFKPNAFADFKLGISFYIPLKDASFSQNSGIAVEPTLLLTWRCPKTETTFGISSDTELVARDFEDNEAELVTRYFITGSWERKLIEKLSIGVEGGYYYLDGFTGNFFQNATLWTTWAPEVFDDWIILNYFFKYQNFDKVIPNYYTYAPQLINHLQIMLSNHWPDAGHFQLGYAHGWQQSRTRFSQIIVNQSLISGPFFWDRREYNTGFLRAGIEQCPFELDLEASYYRDTEKYTIWSVDLKFGWRF